MTTIEEKSTKKELLSLKEFLSFREVAKQKRFDFKCEHQGNGNYLVEAEEYYMSLIGF